MISDPLMRRVFANHGKPRPQTEEEKRWFEITRRRTKSEIQQLLANLEPD